MDIEFSMCYKNNYGYVWYFHVEWLIKTIKCIWENQITTHEHKPRPSSISFAASCLLTLYPAFLISFKPFEASFDLINNAVDVLQCFLSFKIDVRCLNSVSSTLFQHYLYMYCIYLLITSDDFVRIHTFQSINKESEDWPSDSFWTFSLFILNKIYLKFIYW